MAASCTPSSDLVQIRAIKFLHITGPWSRAEHLFTASQDAYDAVAHGEFVEDGGQLAATSGGMTKMSEERSEVLEYEPARFKVLARDDRGGAGSLSSVPRLPPRALASIPRQALALSRCRIVFRRASRSPA